MNHGRYSFAISYDSQKKEIYVFGGCNNKGLENCEKYSIESDSWTDIAPMIEEILLASACVLNNQYIFVIGGYNDDFVNDIEKYSIALNSWESIQIASDLKLTMRAHCLSFSINSSSILIAGGFGDDEY